MITVADLIKAVSKKLKSKYPEIKVWSTDKDKDFGKKCFFIKYTSSKDGKPEFIHEWGEIRIYYFPSDESINRIELLNMQEQLSQLFLFRIPVTDTFTVPVTEIQFEIDDDVLVMSFDYDMYQTLDTEADLPDMEELNLSDLEKLEM